MRIKSICLVLVHQADETKASEGHNREGEESYFLGYTGVHSAYLPMTAT